MSPQQFREISWNGLWKQNTGLAQLLGLCPILAVSTSMVNAVSLGLATILVMAMSNLAVSALLEGDALITEELYQTQALTRAEREEKRRQERNLGSGLNLDRLPLVIVEETYFPYTEGPKFLVNVIGQDVLREAMQSGQGYGPAINRIFQNPPKSTSQVIHPEKYLRNVLPIGTPPSPSYVVVVVSLSSPSSAPVDGRLSSTSDELSEALPTTE